MHYGKVLMMALVAGMILSMPGCTKDWDGHNTRKERKLAKRLSADGGVWQVNEITREMINSDGTTLVLLTATDAGTIEFFEGKRSTGEGVNDYTWNGFHNNLEFGWSVLGSASRIDLYVCCDGQGQLIDSYFDILENEKSRQVWELHFEDSLGFYKTTYTLGK